MGRPQKDTQQHKRDGTYRADRHADRLESPTMTGAPDKPRWLGKEAAAWWDGVIGCLPAEVLGKVDEYALALLVEKWAEWRRYVLALEDIDVTDKEHYKVAMLANMAAKTVQGLLGKFGMTPSDRAKMKIVPPKEDIDELDEMERARDRACGQ